MGVQDRPQLPKELHEIIPQKQNQKKQCAVMLNLILNYFHDKFNFIAALRKLCFETTKIVLVLA